MSWWGKIIGGAFGYLLGGPLGAVLGAALGHNFDKGIDGGGIAFGNQERAQTAFFTATFSVMGYVCKADGRVSEDEIALARTVMNQMELSAAQRETAIRLFREGKKADFPLEDALGQLKRECANRRNLLRMFVEIQLAAAYADGTLAPAEHRLLLHICDRLGIPRIEFEHLEAMIRAERHAAGARARGAARPSGPSIKEAYAILDVSPDSSDADVKKAYRRLLSQHHPDKLVAKGLPEEMMKLAAQKTHEIRQAYERIAEARGL